MTQPDPLSGPHMVSRILHEAVYYPAHSPRSESAAYAKVHRHLCVELDLPCQVCGVRNSTLHDPEHNKVGAKALETHHHVVEWSLQNALDLNKFNQRIVARHRAMPHHDPIYDTDLTQEQMLAWVDHHPDNLWVLCVTPETPVLMANGSQRPISMVGAGDYVIGHDQRPHRVTHVMSSRYSGQIAVIDGIKMTLDHPVLTPGGWLPAGQLSVGDVVYEVRVLSNNVGCLSRIETQVLDAVVGTLPVDVMNTLLARQVPAKVLLQDIDMLHHAATRAFPGEPAHVAPWGDTCRDEPCRTLTRQGIQRNQAAWIAAKPLSVAFGGTSADTSTRLANKRFGPTEHWSFQGDLSSTTARVRTSAVAGSVGLQDAVSSTADDAVLFYPDTELTLRGRWRPIRNIGRIQHDGMLHDIGVSGCRSFIANGIAVHNCDVHHRHTLVGIHSVTYPIWGVQDLLLDSFKYTPDPVRIAAADATRWRSNADSPSGE